jgi:hypothetical protein
MQREQYTYIRNGNKFYYKDKEMTIFHREDGPAIEYADGGKEWYLNGKCHREDGHAIEYADGSKSWYINDELLTEEQFKERVAHMTTILDDIIEQIQEDIITFGEAQNLSQEQIDNLCQIIVDNFKPKY